MSTHARRSGFTLAEVAVTIVIVGTMLIYLLQGLSGTKLLAAQTRNNKLSRELALAKLGQVGSGLFQEDIDKGLTGTFADEGYPDFSYQVVVGDDNFVGEGSESGPISDERFDNWNDPKLQDTKSKDPNDEQVEKPYEKVRIRVTSPKIQEYSNRLTLEQWFPWVQVYGEKKDDKKQGAASSTSSGTPQANGTKQP